jgi:DNA invertase Pin-like site-specific DNA recombinase
LRELGVTEDRIYLDHGLTGTTRARPGLDQALSALREGDTLGGVICNAQTEWVV